MSSPIAFVADTHDNEALVLEQVAEMTSRGVTEMVHLGDVLTPSIMVLYDPIDTVHWVTGNGDQPMKEELSEVVRDMGGEVHRWSEQLTFHGHQFYCRHGMEHDLSYLIAAETDADYVFHGHYHNQERTRVGTSEVLNPGNDGMYLWHPDDDGFEHVTLDTAEESQ